MSNSSTDQKAFGSRYNQHAPVVSPDWQVEIDLHLHTTASDGTLTPTQLIERIALTNLRTIAITDHDSTDGITEAMQVTSSHNNLTLIPGIELGTATHKTDLHLLGYFIDIKNEFLQMKLKQFREERLEVAKAMVEKLSELKRPVSWERIIEMSNGSVGRPHIARAMVEANHVETVAEAFERYLGDEGIARIQRPKLHPMDALKMIHTAGGVGVIAHPRTVKDLNKLVKEMSAAGLVGIEVYAEKYASNKRDKYLDLATKHNLVPTGGTDYHALGGKNETTPGTNGPPPDTAIKLMQAAKAMHGEKVGCVPKGLP